MEEILKRYRNAKDEMADCKALIEESRGINARSSVKGSGSSSYKGSSVEYAVMNTENLINRFYDLEHIVRDIETLIKCLPSQEQALISRRYIDGANMSQIARELNIGYGKATGVHKKAINILDYVMRNKKSEYYRVLGVPHPTT